MVTPHGGAGDGRATPTLARAHRAARRTISFAQYARWRLMAALGREAGGYDETFWDLHRDAEWDWRGFARCIVEAACPTGIVDIGAGDGKLLAAVHDCAPHLPTFGYDSSAVARERASRRGVPVAPLDLTHLRPRVVAEVRGRSTGCDTALCLEVAEHLPPWHARALVRLLAGFRVVVFSAATPGQGGTLHVNERPATYWIHRFSTMGLALHPDDDAFRGALAGLRLPGWYQENTHLFARRPGRRGP